MEELRIELAGIVSWVATNLNCVTRKEIWVRKDSKYARNTLGFHVGLCVKMFFVTSKRARNTLETCLKRPRTGARNGLERGSKCAWTLLERGLTSARNVTKLCWVESCSKNARSLRHVDSLPVLRSIHLSFELPSALDIFAQEPLCFFWHLRRA